MNSLDPWRVMRSSPPAEVMVVPAPYWGHPFYGRGIPQGWAMGVSPAWEHGFERGTGVFVGRSSGAEMTDKGFTAHLDLDPKQVLHAEISIDGKIYKTAINLAPAIAAVMANIAQFHLDLHKAMPSAAPTVSGEVMLGAVDRAVKVAGDELIGTLLGRHYSVAGWWGDLTGGIKKVVDKAGDTVKALKVPISLAAAAGATYLVGPSAAPMAAQMTGALADAAGGDYSSAGTAALNVAEQAASQNPQVKQVLDTAKGAFAQSTAAHHVAATAHQASAGDPKAQQKVAQLAKAATQGDPNAQKVIDAAQSIAGGKFDLSSLTSMLGSLGGGAMPAINP
jgi:hypothetical protein